MKKLFSFFAFVAIVLTFAACGGKDGNVPEIVDQSPIGAWNRRIRLYYERMIVSYSYEWYIFDGNGNFFRKEYYEHPTSSFYVKAIQGTYEINGDEITFHYQWKKYKADEGDYADRYYPTSFSQITPYDETVKYVIKKVNGKRVLKLYSKDMKLIFPKEDMDDFEYEDMPDKYEGSLQVPTTMDLQYK